MIDSWVWIVPLAVGGIGLWRPRWGLYVLVASLPFFGSSPSGPYLEAVSAAALIIVGLAMLRGSPPVSRYQASLIAAVVWLLVAIASLWPWPQAPTSGWTSRIALIREFSYLHGQEPIYGWAVLLNLVLGLGLAWAVLRLVPRNRVMGLVGAIAAGVAVTLALGFLNRIGAIDLALLRPSPRPMDDPRMQSIWVDSRRFAEYLVLAWPFGLAWAAARQRSALWIAAFLVPLLVGFAWSLQRGAWITVVLQFIVLAILWRSRLRHLRIPAAAALVLAITVVVAIPSVRDPLISRATSTHASSRDHFFAVSADLFLQRPILGWGVGAFAPAYRLTAPEHGRPLRGADTAHSLPGQILAERGAIGSLSLLLLLGVLALRRPSEPGLTNNTWIRTAIGLSTVGFIAYGVFQYLPYLKVLEWLLWIIAATWIVITESAGGAPQLARWGGATLTIAALAAVPFQQPRPWQHTPQWGFHGWEGAMPTGQEPTADATGKQRWITGFASTSILHEGDWLSFSMVDGHPRRQDHESTVKVWIDGDLVLEERVPDRWHLCRVPVPRSKDRVIVEFAVDPVFRPFRDPVTESRDARRLGMVLRNDCGSHLCWDLPQGKNPVNRAETVNTAQCYPDPGGSR